MSAAFVGVDLDDQRLDVDLRAARVELVDHGAQLPVQRLGRGDDQRVGRRVGLDEAAGRGRRRRRHRRGGLRRRAAPMPPPSWPLVSAGRCDCCGVGCGEPAARRTAAGARVPLPKAARSTVASFTSRRRSSGRRPRCCRPGRRVGPAGRACRRARGSPPRAPGWRRARSASCCARRPRHRRRCRAAPGACGGAPGAPAPPSARRCTSGARSVATACLQRDRPRRRSPPACRSRR